MKIRGTILHTPERGRLEVLEDQVVSTNHLGVIVSVVPYSADCQPDVELDESVVLLPGLIDTHYHMWSALGRNFLSDDDIKAGLDTGAVFNLDDLSLLPRLLKFGQPDILSFRVNPGYGKSNVGDYVTNAGPGAKFGIHPDQVMDAYRAARDAGIKRFGAHILNCV